MPLINSFFRFIGLLLLVLCLAMPDGHAQSRKKKKKRKAKVSYKKDAMTIKAPTIKGKAQPKSKKKKELVLADTVAEQAAEPQPGLVPYKQFVPSKDKNLLATDFDSLDDAETNIVEVEEQIRTEGDSTWVKVTEYYSLWDTRRVNPYGVDKKAITEPFRIALYDTTMGANWHPPVKSTFATSKFGQRGGRFHYGTDLELDIGDSIYSIWDGIVRITSFDGRGYGYYVVVRHYNGLETLYGHLTEIKTEIGQLVKAGELVGLGGSTGRSSGPHLHFEIRYQGNAINPESFFSFREEHILSDEFTVSPEVFGYINKVARKVFYHRVRSGDTMVGVASKYGLTIGQLARLNRLSARSKLRAGRRLRVK